jgi:hypothetical protein
MGVSPAGVGPGSGSGSGSKGGSKRGSKRVFQSQAEWLLERLDGSDAAWLSHRSRLIRSPCKDSCRRRGWRGRSGDCLGWRGGVPGGSTGGSLEEDSPMTSWLGVGVILVYVSVLIMVIVDFHACVLFIAAIE